MRNSILVFLCFISLSCYSQETKNVLFIGNSYTYYNDMPDLLVQAADSAGDTVIQDDNAIANASWSTHVTKGPTRAKIMQGTWDYVVLQEAGRLPGRDEQFFMQNVYPYASELNDLIEEYNPCGETLFYMNWGERNGVPAECATWPPFCSYETMDDILRARILILTEDFEAETSPVGAVWRYLRDFHPNIDLYDADGYHPSLAGSYAAAISFYCSIFRKDPTLVTFNSTLSFQDASAIKNAVGAVVYNDFPRWFIGSHDPIANFTFTRNGNLEYEFINTSQFSKNYLWDFGDGLSSTDENPTHVYAQDGTYTITLKTNFFCDNASTKTYVLNTLGVQDSSLENSIRLFPNPTSSKMNIEFPESISGEFQFSVFSALGHKVASHQKIIQDGGVILNANELAPGLYFLIISNDDSTVQTLKFVKE